jgi:DNA polymerase-3 subunit epsilon
MPRINGDRRPLSEVEFVAFDLETTGLSPVACRIVEVGAIRFRLDGKELGCVDQLVDPQCPIPAAVTRIHGITNAMVRGKPTLDGLLPEFQSILGGPETVLLAHNARFDLGFLSCAMSRLGVPPPAHTVIDTLKLSRACLRGLFSHRLETVAVHLKLTDREDHRALSDSRLVMGLFQRIVADNPRLETVEDLFRLSPPMGF